MRSCVRWQTNEFWGAKFTVGNVNAENVPNWGYWYQMYKVINRCNRMLANVDKIADMSTNDKKTIRQWFTLSVVMLTTIVAELGTLSYC